MTNLICDFFRLCSELLTYIYLKSNFFLYFIISLTAIFFLKGDMVKDGNGLFLTLLDEGHINLHVRGGYILPLQKPNVTTTYR